MGEKWAWEGFLYHAYKDRHGENWCELVGENGVLVPESDLSMQQLIPDNHYEHWVTITVECDCGRIDGREGEGRIEH